MGVRNAEELLLQRRIWFPMSVEKENQASSGKREAVNPVKWKNNLTAP